MAYFNTFDLENEDENNIPLYEDLSEEEIEQRQKEFANASDEMKDLFTDITGKQNVQFIKLEFLLKHSLDAINDTEDTIEDIEFSDEYMRFLNWLDTEISNGTLYNNYALQVDIFENLFNGNITIYDDNRVVTYIRNKLINESYEDKEMGTLEDKFVAQFEVLSTAKKDIIQAFISLKDIDLDNFSWEDFEALIT